MARFYKGVGVGTYLHQQNLHRSGIQPRQPGAFYNESTIIQHIRLGTFSSPCISLTKSFGVAEAYALEWSKPPATSSNPAFVYEIDISDPPPAPTKIVDPVFELAIAAYDPTKRLTYHHDGDMNFLLGVVDPSWMQPFLNAPTRQPGGSGAIPRPANLEPCLEAMVRALRDAEVLVIGGISAQSVIYAHPVF